MTWRVSNVPAIPKAYLSCLTKNYFVIAWICLTTPDPLYTYLVLHEVRAKSTKLSETDFGKYLASEKKEEIPYSRGIFLGFVPLSEEQLMGYFL